MPQPFSLRLPEDLDKFVESMVTEERTKTNVLLTCIQIAKEQTERGIEKNEYVAQTPKELAPPCTHRVRIDEKTGSEFWCVFRRPCTPVQQTKLKSIDVCSSCKAQEFALPAKTKISESEQEPEQIKPVVSFPLQPNWNPKQANVRKADGSRMCPFYVDAKFHQHCYLCKIKERKKFEECVHIFQNIAMNNS